MKSRRSLLRQPPSLLFRPGKFSKSLFVDPLFSWSCKLLLPQLLSFDNHLRCPGGLGTALLSETLPLRCTVANPLFSRVCRLLDSLASLFRVPVLCFQQLADSFLQNTGGGGTLLDSAVQIPAIKISNSSMPSANPSGRANLPPQC